MRRASGSCRVFTYKEGMLSRVAHDLRLAAKGCEVGLDGERVSARLPLSSLRVEGVMRDGALRADELDAKQRAEIEHALHTEILHTQARPEARYEGRAEPVDFGFRVTGELLLAGERAPLAFEVRHVDGSYSARFTLAPSQWRIQKYKALLGAIRLQDRVDVELSLRET
jgi:YceI-like domain